MLAELKRMPHGGQINGVGLAGSTVIVSLPSVGSTNSRPDAIAAMVEFWIIRRCLGFIECGGFLINIPCFTVLSFIIASLFANDYVAKEEELQLRCQVEYRVKKLS